MFTLSARTDNHLYYIYRHGNVYQVATATSDAITLLLAKRKHNHALIQTMETLIQKIAYEIYDTQVANG